MAVELKQSITVTRLRKQAVRLDLRYVMDMLCWFVLSRQILVRQKMRKISGNRVLYRYAYRQTKERIKYEGIGYISGSAEWVVRFLRTSAECEITESSKAIRRKNYCIVSCIIFNVASALFFLTLGRISWWNYLFFPFGGCQTTLFVKRLRSKKCLCYVH